MHLRAAIVPPEHALDQLREVTRPVSLVPGVTALPTKSLDVPVTAFGNLTPTDGRRLAALLRETLEGAEAPVVRFAGLVEAAAPNEIAVGIVGEVEPLVELARYVPEAAEQLRLYVDRRRFRLALPVLSVADEAPVGMLRSAVASVRDWTGAPWAVPGLALLRTRWVGGRAESEDFDLIRMVERSPLH